MNAPKPPIRCPCCGDPLAELSKRWERFTAPSGKLLRYPAGITATYLCGAAIRSHYVVRNGFSGHLGGAAWRMEATRGCVNILGHALSRATL